MARERGPGNFEKSLAGMARVHFKGYLPFACSAEWALLRPLMQQKRFCLCNSIARDAWL